MTGQELVAGITPQSADVFLFDQHYRLTYEEVCSTILINNHCGLYACYDIIH